MNNSNINKPTKILDVVFSPSALKLYRTSHKLTQDQLARMVGKTAMRICDYENGVRSPNGHTLLRLMIVLGATAEDLSQNSGRPELSPSIDVKQ